MKNRSILATFLIITVILTNSMTAFAEDDVVKSEEVEEIETDVKDDNNESQANTKKEESNEIIEIIVNEYDEKNDRNDSTSNIDEIIYETYGRNQIQDALYYEYNRDTHILKLIGQGDITSLYECVADMPWAVFYDEMTGIEIDGEIKIKLWQACKKSAELSGHLGNYIEVKEKIISQIIDENKKILEKNDDEIDTLYLDYEFFSKVLVALNMTEDELYEKYKLSYEDFIYLYKNDKEKICSIFNIASIDDLFSEENEDEYSDDLDEIDNEIIDNDEDIEIIPTDEEKLPEESHVDVDEETELDTDEKDDDSNILDSEEELDIEMPENKLIDEEFSNDCEEENEENEEA